MKTGVGQGKVETSSVAVLGVMSETACLVYSVGASEGSVSDRVY